MTDIKLPLHGRVVNLIGKKFSNWTVISYTGKSYWLCRCDCGVERKVFTGSLTAEKSRSCGCVRDFALEKTTHGKTKSIEYKSWQAMKRRCLNTTNDNYKYYGGRGIKVCDRWLNSFENFLTDMGERPSPKHSIDRIDGDGNYEPSNCRWATPKEQAKTNRGVFKKGWKKYAAN